MDVKGLGPACGAEATRFDLGKLDDGSPIDIARLAVPDDDPASV